MFNIPGDMIAVKFNALTQFNELRFIFHELSKNSILEIVQYVRLCVECAINIMATVAGKLVSFAMAIIINKNPDAASESALFFLQPYDCTGE